MRDSQNNNMSHIEPVEKFKQLTKKDRLDFYLGAIDGLIPAPTDHHYMIENNPAYGGYRLVLVNNKTGSHMGCFGGNGCEARVKFDVMVLKLQTIIETAKLFNR